MHQNLSTGLISKQVLSSGKKTFWKLPSKLAMNESRWMDMVTSIALTIVSMIVRHLSGALSTPVE